MAEFDSSCLSTRYTNPPYMQKVFNNEACVAVQVVVRRGEAIAGPPGPILVATRNDVLEDIVNRTPQDRRKGMAHTRVTPAHTYASSHLER